MDIPDHGDHEHGERGAPSEPTTLTVDDADLAATTLPSRGGSVRDQPRASYRGDIEGLRAVAVLLVMYGHAGVAMLSGGFVGVDVFFVISGFLITGLLVAELSRTGRISLVAFYARRAKRLLPAAATVLGAVLAVTYLALPPTRWRGIGGDVVASASYWINWRLAAEAVNYLNSDAPPSMLQHFWSLAVEEQFYLIWPVLLIVVASIAARRRRKTGASAHRGYYLLGLALVGIPSLLWSVHDTRVDPAGAYFVTTTRLWELALGAAVAIVSTQCARLPQAIAAAVGWTGLAALAAAAVIVTPATPFPGYAALLPTLGAVGVIASGEAAGRAGPAALLGLRPVRAIGAISYSLYLWHWPLLVGAEARYGTLSTTTTVAIVTLAFVPAAITYRFVENPIRTSPRLATSPMRAIRTGFAFTIVPVLAVGVVQVAHNPLARQVHPADALGAQALNQPGLAGSQQSLDRVGLIVPDPASAVTDVPDIYADHQKCINEGNDDATVKSCAYGSPDSSFTVALVGDSHAAQWAPALEAIAAARGWRLVMYLKSSCPFLDATVALHDRPFTACTRWNASVHKRLSGAGRVDLVIISGAATYRMFRDGTELSGADNTATAEAAMRHAWTDVAATGSPVAVLRDTPRPSFNVPDCVARERDHLDQCTFTPDTSSAASAKQVTAAADIAGVHLVDLNADICPGSVCPPVIGNELVYRDDNHMTATYVRSLTAPLDSALQGVLASATQPLAAP
ncbi:MAG TPA: acyltransferase family protein [Micromonosporaceae bacterium]|nr:acyltransferase family protein [Micromonosporaceae bacterium]